MTGVRDSTYPKSSQSMKSNLWPTTYRGLAWEICPRRNVSNSTNQIFSYRSLNSGYTEGKSAEKQRRQAAEVMRQL